MAEIQPTILKTLKQITGNTTAKTVSELLPELIAMTEADGAPGAVLYSQSQELTAEEQALAQANMGVTPGSDDVYKVNITDNGSVFAADKAYSDVVGAYNQGKIIAFYYLGVLFGIGIVDNGNIYASNVRADGQRIITKTLKLASNEVVTSFSGNGELVPAQTIVSGSTASIAASSNTEYRCGEITALTVSSFPSSGAFTIVFTSGSTATVLTVPNDLHMPDGFVVEANMRYEINVSDGYAACMGWPTT